MSNHIADAVMALAPSEPLGCEESTPQNSSFDPLLTRARAILRPGLSLVELLPLARLALVARPLDAIGLYMTADHVRDRRWSDISLCRMPGRSVTCMARVDGASRGTAPLPAVHPSAV